MKIQFLLKITLSAFILINTAFASTDSHWFVEFEGVGLWALNNDLQYVTSQLNVNQLTENHIVVIDSDLDFAFGVEGGIHFHGSNDVTVRWMHFNNRASNIIDPNIAITRFGFKMMNVDVIGRTDFKSDIINIDMGHHKNLTRFTHDRVFAGLQMIDLNNDLMIADISDINAATITRHTANSQFTGVGPHIGIESETILNDDFSVVGHVNGAILIGDLDTHSKREQIVGGNRQSMMRLNMSETIIAPTAEAKLGLKLKHKTQNGMLSFESGYRVNAIVDANKWLHYSMVLSNPWASHVAQHGVYLAGRFIHT